MFEECLDQLLQFRTICGKKCESRKYVVGTLLLVSRVCLWGGVYMGIILIHVHWKLSSVLQTTIEITTTIEIIIISIVVENALQT